MELTAARELVAPSTRQTLMVNVVDSRQPRLPNGSVLHFKDPSLADTDAQY